MLGYHDVGACMGDLSPRLTMPSVSQAGRECVRMCPFVDGGRSWCSRGHWALQLSAVNQPSNGPVLCCHAFFAANSASPQGQQNSEQDAHEQLDYALAHGVNFIDTAEM
jgi:hypothetical protein